jgi:hypothetical protein
VDAAGPFIVGAMVLALLVAALIAKWKRWWVAALAGTVIAEVAFLYWVPISSLATYALGFLPFAAIPALLGAMLASWYRNKERQ